MSAPEASAASAITETDPAALVALFEARARRIDTPCGSGTMAWRIWGEGPSLVLAHGGQGAWSHWIANIDTLAQRYTVIAPDLPGHGDSAMPQTADNNTICAALAEGLKTILGEGGTADFVGFSFGGVVLAHLAALQPALFRRLVVVGTGGLDTPHGQIDIGRVGGLEGEERRAAIRRNLLGLMLHHPESVDEMAMHLLVANGRRVQLGGMQDLVLPDRLLQVLPHIAVPVDAIWGELDRPHPDPAVQEAVLRRFQPHMDFRVVAEAGHWAMYERPGAFNAALLAMLAMPVRTI